MYYRDIRKEDDAALAALIRGALKKRGLDIPGTAYYDTQLDHLSSFYLAEPEKRAYIVLADDSGKAAGGAGLAECSLFAGCAELQKLYLAKTLQGHGLGYELIRLVEDRARELGYLRIYLETHTCLQAALHLYEKTGYRSVNRPEAVVHSSMDRFFIKELFPA